MTKKKKILIMGLPGAGKTYLANKLHKELNAIWINADKVRKDFNDWDFSPEGRLRQSKRMKDLADKAMQENQYVVVDFICPTPKNRVDFAADFTIWMDTIKEGRFDDTNKMFVKPLKFDFRVTEKNADYFVKIISKKIRGV